MNNKIDTSNQWEDKNKKNSIRLGFWTAGWLITMALATFGSILIWESATLTAISICTNLVVGLGMIAANKDQLKGLDELQRKIQLEAMGLSLGIGIVVGLSYEIMSITKLISFDAEISHLVILIGLTYGLGILLGRKRYQ